jgi:hypothetical protein
MVYGYLRAVIDHEKQYGAGAVGGDSVAKTRLDLFANTFEAQQWCKAGVSRGVQVA